MSFMTDIHLLSLSKTGGNMFIEMLEWSLKQGQGLVSSAVLPFKTLLFSSPLAFPLSYVAQ